MKQPVPHAEFGQRLRELRALIDDVLHDHGQVAELGLVQGRRGEGGGRPTGDSDPTGDLASNLFEGDSEEDRGVRTKVSGRVVPIPAWRRAAAVQAMLNAERKVRDATAAMRAARTALFQPFKEQGPRDPIKARVPQYDGALKKTEHERLQELARERRARGEE